MATYTHNIPNTNKQITLEITPPTNYTNNGGFIAQSKYNANDIEHNSNFYDKFAKLMNCMEIDWGNISCNDKTDLALPEHIKTSIDLLHYIFALEGRIQSLEGREQYIHVNSISFPQDTYHIYVHPENNEQLNYISLTPTILPENATNKGIIWDYTAYSGSITYNTALDTSSCKITMTNNIGTSATETITVKAKAADDQTKTTTSTIICHNYFAPKATYDSIELISGNSYQVTLNKQFNNITWSEGSINWPDDVDTSNGIPGGTIGTFNKGIVKAIYTAQQKDIIISYSNFENISIQSVSNSNVISYDINTSNNTIVIHCLQAGIAEINILNNRTVVYENVQIDVQNPELEPIVTSSTTFKSSYNGHNSIISSAGSSSVSITAPTVDTNATVTIKAEYNGSTASNIQYTAIYVVQSNNYFLGVTTQETFNESDLTDYVADRPSSITVQPSSGASFTAWIYPESWGRPVSAISSLSNINEITSFNYSDLGVPNNYLGAWWQSGSACTYQLTWN